MEDATVFFNFSGSQAVDLLYILESSGDSAPHVRMSLASGITLEGQVIEHEVESEHKGVSPRVSGEIEVGV